MKNITTAAPPIERATALISLSKEDKDKLIQKAKEHGLSLSALLRLAAFDYIQRNGW